MIGQAEPSPGHSRRAGVLWLAGLSLAGLGLSSAIGVLTRDHPPRFDLWLHDVLVEHRSDSLVSVARVVTEAGSTTVIWPVIATAALIFPRTPGGIGPRSASGWLTSAAVAAGAGTAIGVRLLLSNLLQRARPPSTGWATTPGGWAFPSGHTTAATIGAGVLAWAASRQLRSRQARVAVWVTAAVWAASVGLTRAVLGVHWPLDVVGGWLLGAGWLAGLAALGTLPDKPARRKDAT